MQMTDHEIAMSYRTAKKQKEQITVLAELNAVSVDEMREKLRALGFTEVAPAQKRSKGGRPLLIDYDRAMELYARGFTDAAIGEALDVAEASVRSWRRRMGIPSHNRRRAEELKKNKERETEAAVIEAETVEEFPRPAAPETEPEASPCRCRPAEPAVSVETARKVFERLIAAGLGGAGIRVDGIPIIDVVSINVVLTGSAGVQVDFATGE